MDVSERNRNNVLIRWNRKHKADVDYIKNQENRFSDLKSRICAFLAGDGNILSDNGLTCRHNTIRFFPDHISLVKSFEEALLKVYNKRPKIIKKNNYFFITLDSKPVVLDLLSYCNFGKMNWKIPSFVFNSTKNKIEWLRAFFDCEAYVHKNYISVKSVNQKGMNQIRDLLEEFDITSKIYSYKPKNNNWNINYMLRILKKKDREYYARLIGFNHSIKFKKLNKSLNY